MHNRSLLYTQFFILAAIAILYFVGLFLYLQWVFWWYDIMLHFLGGVWVALATCTVLKMLGYTPRFIHIIASIAVIGIAWEIFEVIIGAYRESNYAQDTTIDLIMDTVGSIVGFVAAGYIRETPEL